MNGLKIDVAAVEVAIFPAGFVPVQGVVLSCSLARVVQASEGKKENKCDGDTIYLSAPCSLLRNLHRKVGGIWQRRLCSRAAALHEQMYPNSRENTHTKEGKMIHRNRVCEKEIKINPRYPCCFVSCTVKGMLTKIQRKSFPLLGRILYRCSSVCVGKFLYSRCFFLSHGKIQFHLM